MRFLLSIFTALLLTTTSFAQTKGIVVSSETLEPIPYTNIWVLDQEIGTTANQDGRFTLREITGEAELVFSSIGYLPFKINTTVLKDTIKLQPDLRLLDNVIVNAKKRSRKLVIDKIRNKSVNTLYGCRGYPWIAGKFFKYQPKYEKTPFLSSVGIHTFSQKKRSKFQIRLYKMNEAGEPEQLLNQRPIFGYTQQGSKITEVNLKDFHLQFPIEGLLVGFEWLIIEENEYKFVLSTSADELLRYEPLVAREKHNNGVLWKYHKGKWHQLSMSNPLKIELELRN